MHCWRVRLVYCGLPTRSIESLAIEVTSSDLFYLTHMDAREELTERRQLDELLIGPQPALLLISKSGVWGQLPVHSRIRGPLSLLYQSYDVLAVNVGSMERPL